MLAAALVLRDLAETSGINLDLAEADQKPSPDRLLMREHWSSRVNSLDEVADELGKIRQLKR